MDFYSRIAQQLGRLANGGVDGADSRWHPLELELFARNAHNALIRNDYYINLRDENIHNVGGQFMTEFFNLPIVTDTERREGYLQLTSNFVNLPSGKGIAEVYGYDETLKKQVSFSAMPSVSSSLTKGLWATTALAYGYRLEGDRLYLVYHNTKLPFLKANVKLVVGNPLTVGADQEAVILAEAWKLMSVRNRPDLVNDNNPTA